MECNRCRKSYKNSKSLNKHSKICKAKNCELKNNEKEKIFNLEDYLDDINKKIEKVMKQSKYNEDIIEDILLDKYIEKNVDMVKFTKKLKQLQMNIGKIWQITIGNYHNFVDLGEGDVTSLDVKSDKRKIIMEIKNRYNTDNASSRKTNLSKLAKYKKENPEYECIYAIINEKQKSGKDDIITHDGMNIRYLSGQKLLDFIFNNDKEIIMNNLEKQISILAL
jgi:hypothetical protein